MPKLVTKIPEIQNLSSPINPFRHIPVDQILNFSVPIFMVWSKAIAIWDTLDNEIVLKSVVTVYSLSPASWNVAFLNKVFVGNQQVVIKRVD